MRDLGCLFFIFLGLALFITKLHSCSVDQGHTREGLGEQMRVTVLEKMNSEGRYYIYTDKGMFRCKTIYSYMSMSKGITYDISYYGNIKIIHDAPKKKFIQYGIQLRNQIQIYT